MTSLNFPASRLAGLERLQRFIPKAGLSYAQGRNIDPGPHQPSAVSLLSPYLRHRLITEREVVASVLDQHGFSAAEKFIQEICWRTYWKGWLEMRPKVWTQFLEDRDHLRQAFKNTSLLREAEEGRTGIDGFDHWAIELKENGYLHNHARMWFASIWIFTLKLPWVLGTDFFLRHLIDADAASNTLSWRWVAGLQTIGKTYLATRENIERFTQGRFSPKGLATEAQPLTEDRHYPVQALRACGHYDRSRPALMLLTCEDLHPESAFDDLGLVVGAFIGHEDDFLWGERARYFVNQALIDCQSRVKNELGLSCERLDRLDADSLMKEARAAGVPQIITPYAPVGPVADRLAMLTPLLAKEGIILAQLRREWDRAFWPHAQKGFFQLKAQIPDVLRMLGH